MKNRELISIIVPFYNGNKYLERLLTSIYNVEKEVLILTNYDFEILIMNDSPNVKVIIPEKFCKKDNIKIIDNPENLGIHRTKINGYNHSKGKYLLFLDQDDEMVLDGFENQIELIKDNAVVVGNSYYQRNKKNHIVFKNLKVMQHCISKERMINIRDFVPSLGCCIFKKDIIPNYWLKNPMTVNGSDDYYLLLILLVLNIKFAYNEEVVFCHNEGDNLSSNLKQMFNSNLEMFKLLTKYDNISHKDLMNLRKAIEFQYYKSINLVKSSLKYNSSFFKALLNKIQILIYKLLY